VRARSLGTLLSDDSELLRGQDGLPLRVRLSLGPGDVLGYDEGRNESKRQLDWIGECLSALSPTNVQESGWGA
jgi:hypothetical protein